MSIVFKNNVNWKYAIGEVILIFIGITLAIAFNNWNEERNSIRQGKEYMRAIYKDLHNEIDVLLLDIEQLEEQYISSQNLLQIVESDDKKIRDTLTFLKDLNAPGLNINPERLGNTYDELKPSGKLAMIRDDSLTTQLTLFYHLYQKHIHTYNQLPLIARFEWRRLLVQSSNLKTRGVWKKDDVDLSEASPLIDDLMSNERVPKLLIEIYGSADTNLRRVEELVNYAQSIIDYMEENLNHIVGNK